MAMREESGKPHPDPPEEQESRLWSVLPQDLLRLIVEPLSLVDLIRLRAVCKDWLRAPIHDLQPIHNLPWIMNHWFTLTSRLCLLFEPFRRLPYVIEDTHVIPGKMGLPPGSIELPAATVCASRFGWVLFTKGLEYCLFRRVVKDMAGNVRVTLYRKAPEHQTLFRDFAATFSSIPTSPDCVFFVSHPSTSDQIFISTHSIGDKSWKTHTFTCPNASSYSAESVVYMEGSFYCFSERGLLASFNIATQEWRPLVSIMWDMPLWPRERYFLEYGGRLRIVFMENESEYSGTECDIFRFDWLDRVWVKMESLEGGVIFLGNPCFGVSAGEKTKMVAIGFTISFGTHQHSSLMGLNWIDPPLLQPWQVTTVGEEVRLESVWLSSPLKLIGGENERPDLQQDELHFDYHTIRLVEKWASKAPEEETESILAQP
ncbi:F-box protein [Vitis vinifera]|uniref:F-box protein n=1 Tax=Vitis vinifera TaxID=29760 RepID=A0A438F0C6_VITVI|nr:F-box protein [Vitis vinifera]